ncbi:MAG: PTS sugar transporter subunit IIA [Kiritimatiellia bacterium]
MNLAHHLFPECILTGFAASSRDELLARQVDLVHARLRSKGIPSPPPGEMLQSVLARENLQSTCLGEGLAVPHARMDNLSTLGLSVAVLPTPVAFDGAEEKDVTLSVLVLAPLHDPNLVLKIWGAFIRLFRSPGFKESAARGPDPRGSLRHPAFCKTSPWSSRSPPAR